MARPLCLVTGASAGIGAALAKEYAFHGYDLCLVARRLDRLEALAKELAAAHGVEAFAAPADLSAPDGCEQALAAGAARGRPVDALVNNAGFSINGAYATTGWADQRAFLKVMVEAMAEMVHRVLPGMIERRSGRILNVASVAGLTPGAAGHTLYGAAKAFVISMSESLHLETRGQGVRVTALCPGFTYSEFHDVNGTRALVSSLPKRMWLDAAAVARAGYRAVEANQPICVPGPTYKAIAALNDVLPRRLALAVMARQSAKIRKA